MDDENKQEFMQIMVGLAENFSATIGNVGLQMRFEALRNYSIQDIYNASMSILKTRPYTTMPTVADFITALDGDPIENAEIQSSIVRKALGEVGTFPEPKFFDPITHDIVYNRIGWHNIKYSNMDKIPFFLKQFKDMYIAYKKVEKHSVVKIPQELKDLLGGKIKQIGRV